MIEPQLRVNANADRTTTVRLSGEVNSAGLPCIRRVLDGVARAAPLIVDLTDVTYVDAAGVELLFEYAREAGLELILGPGCAVFPVIQVSGLDQVATLR